MHPFFEILNDYINLEQVKQAFKWRNQTCGPLTRKLWWTLNPIDFTSLF